MSKQQDEAKVMNRIVSAFEKGDQRLLRNNVGKIQIHPPHGPWISFGVGGKGGADLIGWTTVEITPDMVGSKIAVFSAVEVKDGSNQATDDQVKFLKMVKDAGGRCGVARSLPDARKIFSGKGQLT